MYILSHLVEFLLTALLLLPADVQGDPLLSGRFPISNAIAVDGRLSRAEFRAMFLSFLLVY
jgi:hypothetical protein